MITVVLDDDPTGTQAMSDVSVVLDWHDPAAWATVDATDAAVHVLTNSRAFDGAQAAEMVISAASTARRWLPDSRVLLRGDSTLRGHLWEEYAALREVIAPGREDVPLLLVPALPAAGRVTVDGVHLIEREGVRVPLHESEYSKDGVFAYASADLAEWAHERSNGRLSADDAIKMPLPVLRTAGAEAVVSAISSGVSLGRPAVVIPDAEDERDLQIIGAGLRLAEGQALPAVVRCAPAFVATLTGKSAVSHAVMPTDAAESVLIVCGSFVATTTAQLDRLEAAYPGVTITADVLKLAGDGCETELDRVCGEARDLVDSVGLAVVATQRQRNQGLVDLTSQRRIASTLAQVARRVPAGVVIAKGGITSAVTAREGLGAHAARVVGALRPGVGLWRLADGRAYVVVPGNVGGPELLVDLVQSMREPRAVGASGC